MIYTLYAILLLVLIYFIGFFASSETAFVSLNKIQLRQAATEKRRHVKLITKMHSKMDKLLSTVLIGTNLVSTFSSSLATMITVGILGETVGPLVSTIVMTVLIIIFGEILPKTIATTNPYQIAQRHAILLRIFDIIFTPFTLIFEGMSKAINKFISTISKNPMQKIITEDELKTLIDMGNKEGTLESHEKHILNNIVEFGDLRVRDIMKPKVLIVGVNENSTYDEILDTFARSGYSKLPVYRENLENIIGIINFKDMFDEKNFSIAECMKKPRFVPETVSAITFLQYLKNEKTNIAIVVDEMGSNCGLITMENVLSAVFGRTMQSFANEDESPINRIQIISNNQYIIPGEIHLSDLNKVFSMNLKSQDFDTLGGWLLEQFGSLPNIGDVIKRNGIIYEIEDICQRRIKLVKMTLSNKM